LLTAYGERGRVGADSGVGTCSAPPYTLLDVTPDPRFTDPRPGDIHQSCADASRARADLAWAPQVSFEDGLARYLDWLRAG
jgi:nucleoside-diphosphate-sugar epimerase